MSSPEKEPFIASKPLRRPFYIVLAHKVEDLIDDINWLHVAFKICAFTYIGFIVWITWHVLPLPGHWDVGRQSDKIPMQYQDLNNYFDSFKGASECGIYAHDLYKAPVRDEDGSYAHKAFCPNRGTLLQAMSSGGRVGFDAPYNSKDCYFRWYTVAEICMILERFDGLVLVGDATLQAVYNGINILLRQDLESGSLQTWSMDPDARAECRCNNQFVKSSCSEHYITDSDQVSKSVGHVNSDLGNSYVCERMPHSFIKIDATSPDANTLAKFSRFILKAPRSHYKPIPIIHSLSPVTASHGDAATSLLSFIEQADKSQRNTPILWVGPSAAGHIDIRGRLGNQQIWDFDRNMKKVARENGVEVLGMWNMTVQASSWDGVRFGEKVALEQAMMIINWLGRLESS